MENRRARFSKAMRNAGWQDLDLLQCLLGIDQRQLPDARAWPLIARLVDWGLAENTADGLALTSAGVERCKSLQHRVASDQSAQGIRKERAKPAVEES